MIKRNDMMSVKDVQEMLGIPLLGAIPEDEQVRGRAANNKVTGGHMTVGLRWVTQKGPAPQGLCSWDPRE